MNYTTVASGTGPGSIQQLSNGTLPPLPTKGWLAPTKTCQCVQQPAQEFKSVVYN